MGLDCCDVMSSVQQVMKKVNGIGWNGMIMIRQTVFSTCDTKLKESCCMRIFSLQYSVLYCNRLDTSYENWSRTESDYDMI